jgi:hypothetical protein
MGRTGELKCEARRGPGAGTLWLCCGPYRWLLPMRYSAHEISLNFFLMMSISFDTVPLFPPFLGRSQLIGERETC